MLSLRSLLARLVAAAILLVASSACNDVDQHRIPVSPVRVSFATIGDWHTWGIGGALDTRIYIRGNTNILSEPSGFPYTGLSATGYGGLLLVGTFDFSGDPLNTPPAVFDLSCPVEMRKEIRVEVDMVHHEARCPVCGSTYDIFHGTGMPRSGTAAQEKYALRRYSARPGASGEYLVLSN